MQKIQSESFSIYIWKLQISNPDDIRSDIHTNNCLKIRYANSKPSRYW